MPRRSKEAAAFTDANAVKAAYYVGERGMSQDQVAVALGVSPATVSRLIAHARQTLHCLESAQRFVRTNVRKDLLDQIEDERLHTELSAVIARVAAPRPLRALQIFDSGGGAAEGGIDRRQQQFGARLAPYLADRLLDARVIGVTWGSTVSRVLDGLERIGTQGPGRAVAHPTIVPVAAEPMRYAHNEFTSSTLARRLNRVLNGEQGERLAVTGMPAFIPLDFRKLLPEARRWSRAEHDDFNKAFHAFFRRSSPAYRRIFGETPGRRAGLVTEIDALLTCVGPADKPLGFNNEDLLEFGGVTKETLETLVAGDVGGVLLPRGASARARIGQLNAMWTGITRDDLERIADRGARSPSAPGVLVVAIGAKKCEIVGEALARGLCTELLIDRELAAELLGALPRRTAEPATDEAGGPRRRRS
jgi:DNA-binding transcriptional regulator LsrR (DeoR family)